MMRLSWTQPEDLLPHALAAADLDGRRLAAAGIRRRWIAAGGSPAPVVGGASPGPASEELRALARELLDELDRVPYMPALDELEPEELEDILVGGGSVDLPDPGRRFEDRVLGAWLGRAAGCLLGKPVEKLPLEGIRAIGRETGNWPLRGYFTAAGLGPDTAKRYPWNRRSAPNSLAENIDGMPEDDDLNFTLLALHLLETVGDGFGTEHVAQSWLDNLPGGRVFTAERITYRNLLDGYTPEEAGRVRNPFREWIGAQIRADLYGWARPGDPFGAAELAWHDARLSHGRRAPRRRAQRGTRGPPARQPLRRGDLARRGPRFGRPRRRSRDRRPPRRIRPPPLGPRPQQRRAPRVRPRPRRGRLRTDHHARRLRRLGHRLGRSDRGRDHRGPDRREQSSGGVD
jgi:hypothetical protein